MGRCQGAFCTVRCMELLAQRLERPFSAVSKRGGGFWIVMELGPPQHPAASTAVTSTPTADEAR
jgi:hypothetical protein